MALAAALGFALGLVFLGKEIGYVAFILAVGYAGYLLRQNWRQQGRLLVVTSAVFLVFPTAFYLHQYLTYGKAFIPLIVGSGLSWVPPGWTVAGAYASHPTEGFDYPVFHLDWRQPEDWWRYLVNLFTTSWQPVSFLPADFPAELYLWYFLLGWCGLIGVGRSIRAAAGGATAEVRSRRWLLGSAIVAGGVLLGVVVRHSFVVLYQPDGRHLLPLLVPAVLLLFHGWRTVARNPEVGRMVAALGVSFFLGSGMATLWLLLPLYV